WRATWTNAFIFGSISSSRASRRRNSCEGDVSPEANRRASDAYDGTRTSFSSALCCSPILSAAPSLVGDRVGPRFDYRIEFLERRILVEDRLYRSADAAHRLLLLDGRQRHHFAAV